MVMHDFLDRVQELAKVGDLTGELVRLEAQLRELPRWRWRRRAALEQQRAIIRVAAFVFFCGTRHQSPRVEPAVAVKRSRYGQGGAWSQRRHGL